MQPLEQLKLPVGTDVEKRMHWLNGNAKLNRLFSKV